MVSKLLKVKSCHFVVAVCIDSRLIRGYVEEALAEIAATMLSERESRKVATPLEQPEVQVDTYCSNVK